MKIFLLMRCKSKDPDQDRIICEPQAMTLDYQEAPEPPCLSVDGQLASVAVNHQL